MSAEQARRVGELAGRSGHEDIFDGTVVEGALRRGDVVVVTYNESHIQKVLGSTGRSVRVEAV